MKNLFVYTMLALVLVIGGMAYMVRQAEGNGQLEWLSVIGKNGVEHKFEVEIADTDETREKGLMYRRHMADNRGMLFEMGATAPVGFWMKNTLIPLDILFIDGAGVIKKIHANAVPGDLSPLLSEVPVTGVLEINGGLAKTLGIAPGDKVVHPYFKDVQ